MALSLAEKMALKTRGKKAAANEAVEKKEPVKRASPPPRQTESSGSLLRQQMEAAAIDQTVRYIDIERIDIEAQVRTDFDEEYIQDLAIDFALNEAHPYQPKNPVTIYERANGRFLLDTGENRMRAIRYGQAHREELGVNDVTAFTQVRASVIGPEPEKIKRVQSQVKENILRDELNYAELGNALKLFFTENPSATQTQAAEWCGFQNSNSGRVKVNKALKLMKLDQDLIDQVANDKIAVDSAITEQAQRTQQQATATFVDNQQEAESVVTQPAVKTAKPKHAKQQTISIPLDKGVELIQLMNWAANQASLEAVPLKKSPNRKEIMEALKGDLLDKLIERIAD